MCVRAIGTEQGMEFAREHKMIYMETDAKSGRACLADVYTCTQREERERERERARERGKWACASERMHSDTGFVSFPYERRDQIAEAKQAH